MRRDQYPLAIDEMPAPAPLLRRAARSPVLRFLAVGGLSYVVDIATLYVLHGRAGLPLVPSTAAALTTGLLTNFTLNRVAFGAHGDRGRVRAQLARYVALVAANYALTLVTVALLVAAGVEYLLAKTLSVAANAVLNYFAYRFWVFRPREPHAVSTDTAVGE